MGMYSAATGGFRKAGFAARAAVALIACLAVAALSGCGAPPAYPPPATTPSPSPATPTATIKPSPTVKPVPSPSPTQPPSPRYTLGLSVSPAGSGTVSPSGGTYDIGARVTLQATPANTCWAFDRWTGDVSGNATSMPLTLDGNKSITANFVRIRYSLSTTVMPAGRGSVGPASGTYDCGASVTVVATPVPGYDFDHWGGDASGISPSANITMQSNKNVTAFFKASGQTIKRDMPPGSSAVNTITFTALLKAGEKVSGFVELTGEPHPEDATYSWSFTITGPLGTKVDDWTGNVSSTQRHDFDRTVRDDGNYAMKVTHTSRWAKSLTIQISPGGWQ